MRVRIGIAAIAAMGLLTAVPASASGAAQAPQGLDALTGQMLRAVDGSTLTLQPDEDGLTRVLIAPNGNVERTHFGFLNATLGTVSDAQDPTKLVGVFRQSGNRIAAQFSDGHSETLQVTAGGGLSLSVRAADGEHYCKAWFPKGHSFSQAERRTALAEYAKRLGVSLPGARPAGDTVAHCAAPAMSAPAQAASAEPPKPMSLAKAAHAAKAARTAAEGQSAAKSILVRTSAVHAIDAAAAAPGAGSAAELATAMTAGAGPAASACLSVGSDGHHWGFRNRCGYPVQFVYCLKGGNDPLTACANGSVAGSVESDGFAALAADRTLSETDADHRFRWVACRGGAGEVIPRLDRTSPPAGRCIRATAS